MTPQQRIAALLADDFDSDDTSRIAARRDVLDALPQGPALDRYIPAPVTLPKVPERLIAH